MSTENNPVAKRALFLKSPQTPYMFSKEEAKRIIKEQLGHPERIIECNWVDSEGKPLDIKTHRIEDQDIQTDDQIEASYLFQDLREADRITIFGLEEEHDIFP